MYNYFKLLWIWCAQVLRRIRCQYGRFRGAVVFSFTLTFTLTFAQFWIETYCIRLYLQLGALTCGNMTLDLSFSATDAEDVSH